MNLRRRHSPKLAESQHFELEIRRAGLMLYALQIAAQLTARQEESKPSKSVRTLLKHLRRSR